MKKLILLAAALCTGQLRSQILNSGFESLNADGTIKNWSGTFLTITLGDSLVFDNQLYFSTNEAYSGSRALEMRNAYNYSTSQQIPGIAKLSFNDSIYGSFGPMVSLTQTPLHFNFFYKFFPAGPDTALASIHIWDNTGNEIGSGRIEISSATAVYSLASTPIVYSAPGPAAFVSVQFQTAKPGSPASFGTRFLVDDVNSIATGFPQPTASGGTLRCFPNPVQDQLYLELDRSLAPQPGSVSITDALGRIVYAQTISGSGSLLHLSLPVMDHGHYLLSLTLGDNTYTQHLIK